MAAPYLSWPADYPGYAEKRCRTDGAELLSIGPWNTAAAGSAGCEDMPRKSIDIRLTDYPVLQKRATAPFSCLPARTGAGRARCWVKGLVPCGFLGQRPKPSESLPGSISAIFKVHLSLFFLAHFFIDYLTLPFLKRDRDVIPVLLIYCFPTNVPN